MATFAYVGRTKSGAVRKGELVAKTRDEAVEILRKQSVVVTSLQEKAGKAAFSFSIGGGISEKDLVVFTRQFGTYVFDLTFLASNWADPQWLGGLWPIQLYGVSLPLTA